MFTLSSSRSPAGIEPIAEKNQFQCCIIAFEGALILDKNRRILYEMGMNKMTAGKVIDIRLTSPIPCVLLKEKPAFIDIHLFISIYLYIYLYYIENM